MKGAMYNEKQEIMPAFVNIIMMAVTVSLVAVAAYVIYEYGFDDDAMWLLITAVIIAAVTVLMMFLKIKIAVSYDSLIVGVFKGRTVPIKEIVSVAVEEFSAIKDYGGWGLRYNLKTKTLGYIARGTNKGMRINTADGKSFLVSSKRVNEFQGALNMVLRTVKRTE